MAYLGDKKILTTVLVDGGGGTTVTVDGVKQETWEANSKLDKPTDFTIKGLMQYNPTTGVIDRFPTYQGSPAQGQIPVAKKDGRITTNTPQEDLDCANKKFVDKNKVKLHTIQILDEYDDVYGGDIYFYSSKQTPIESFYELPNGLPMFMQVFGGLNIAMWNADDEIFYRVVFNQSSGFTVNTINDLDSYHIADIVTDI